MLKKIGATENDVLSEKSQNENSSHWMHPPSVVNPRKGSQTLATATKPLDTDKHAPLPFQQAPRQRFGDSLLARLYVCLSVCLYICTDFTHTPTHHQGTLKYRKIRA